MVKASSKPNCDKEFAQDSAGNNNEQKKREMGRERERRGRRGRGERWWATAREQRTRAAAAAVVTRAQRNRSTHTRRPKSTPVVDSRNILGHAKSVKKTNLPFAHSAS